MFSLSILLKHCWVVFHCLDRCHLLQKRAWQGKNGALQVGMRRTRRCCHLDAAGALEPSSTREHVRRSKGEGASLCGTQGRQEFQEGKGSLWSTWHEELPSDHGNSSVGSQPENRVTTALPHTQKKSERRKEGGGGGVGGAGERSWGRISLAETERLPGRQIQPIMLVGFTGFPFHFQSFLLPLSFPF